MAILARWFTWDALKAVFYGVIATAVCTGGYVLYRDLVGGAVAQAQLQCAQANNAANAAEQSHVDTLNAAAESAAQTQRDLHRNDGGKATARALSVQKELQTLTAKDGDPVCFPKDLAKALQ